MLKRLVLLLVMLAAPAWAQLPGGAEIQINRTPVVGGTATQCLYVTAANRVGNQACGAGTSADVTVGTTTVTGGTTSGLLYKASNGTLGSVSGWTSNGSTTLVASGTDNSNPLLSITQAGTTTAAVAIPGVSAAAMVTGTSTVYTAQGTLAGQLTPALQMHATSQQSVTMGLFNWSTSASSPGLFNFNKSKSGTIGSRAAVASGDFIGAIQGTGDDGTNFATAARISFFVDGTPGAGDMPGRISFWTSPDGSVTPVERARIDAAGNVVINTAAVATNAANGFLYVTGTAGTPTGTPTAYTGRVPIVVDTTNNKLYFYSNGAWRDAGP